MNLVNYLEEIKEQDKKGKYQKINEENYIRIVEETLNSSIVPKIEEHLLPALIKLEPFMTHPLVIIYHTLRNAMHYSKIPSLKLKEKFGERLNLSADCFNRNMEVSFNNAIKKDSFSLEKIKNLEELGKRIELNELNREIIQNFNKYFPKHKLMFKLEDFNYLASQARKEIREKYSVDFRALQRETDLKRLQH